MLIHIVHEIVKILISRSCYHWKSEDDSRIRNIVLKGPKYSYPSQIDFNRCKGEIASALNDFGNRWCKRESVECSAMKK